MNKEQNEKIHIIEINLHKGYDLANSLYLHLIYTEYIETKYSEKLSNIRHFGQKEFDCLLFWTERI